MLLVGLLLALYAIRVSEKTKKVITKALNQTPNTLRFLKAAGFGTFR